MAPAVDGRIVTRDRMLLAGLTAEYEGTAAALRGDAGTPSLFDAGPRGAPRHLQLLSAERRRGGLLWVRYRVRHGGK